MDHREMTLRFERLEAGFDHLKETLRTYFHADFSRGLDSVLAAYDREIARLHAEPELPATPPPEPLAPEGQSFAAARETVALATATPGFADPGLGC